MGPRLSDEFVPACEDDDGVDSPSFFEGDRDRSFLFDRHAEAVALDEAWDEEVLHNPVRKLGSKLKGSGSDRIR